MEKMMDVVAHIVIGPNVADGKAYGRYRFHQLPRVGETILIDKEQGDPSDHIELTVQKVLHFPVSLEAPMGPVPTLADEYVMLLCSR